MDEFTKVIAEQAKRRPKYITVKLTLDQISQIIAALTMHDYDEAYLDDYQKAHNAFNKRLINTLHKARVS